MCNQNILAESRRKQRLKLSAIIAPLFWLSSLQYKGRRMTFDPAAFVYLIKVQQGMSCHAAKMAVSIQTRTCVLAVRHATISQVTNKLELASGEILLKPDTVSVAIRAVVKLRVSIFPWIGITLQDMSLGCYSRNMVKGVEEL